MKIKYIYAVQHGRKQLMHGAIFIFVWCLIRCEVMKRSLAGNLSQPAMEKPTPNHVAVRETSVSRHHGTPIEGPLKTHHSSEHHRIAGFKGGGASIFPRIMRRGVSLSEWEWEILQSPAQDGYELQILMNRSRGPHSFGAWRAGK